MKRIVTMNNQKCYSKAKLEQTTDSTVRSSAFSCYVTPRFVFCVTRDSLASAVLLC